MTFATLNKRIRESSRNLLEEFEDPSDLFSTLPFFLKAFPRGHIRCSCDISAMLRCEVDGSQSVHFPFWPRQWSDYEPGQCLSFNIRAHVSMTRHLRTLRGPTLTSSAMLSQLAATECFNVIFVRVDGFRYLSSRYGDSFIDDARHVSFDPQVGGATFATS